MNLESVYLNQLKLLLLLLLTYLPHCTAQLFGQSKQNQPFCLISLHETFNIDQLLKDKKYKFEEFL